MDSETSTRPPRECSFCGQAPRLPGGAPELLILADCGEDVRTCRACLLRAANAQLGKPNETQDVTFEAISCAFCGRSKERSRGFVTANGIIICGDCIRQGLRLLRDELEWQANESSGSFDGRIVQLARALDVED